MDKRQLRRQLRQIRSALSPQKRQEAERIISQYLSRWIKRNKRIAVYWAMGSELKLDAFTRAAQKRGAQIYLPYLEPHSLKLWFTPYPSNHKHAERPRGTAKLRVPQWSGHKIRARQLHTMLLPIVGIDQAGYRLGQGGGYYDCTLGHTHLRPRTIAVGFACQQIAQLPTQAHDICTDYFVSEHGVQRFKQKG